MSYRIKHGDTLASIARNHNVSLGALLAANPRLKADPDRIGVGDVIQIAGGGATTDAPTAPSTDTSSTTDTGDDFKVPQGQLTFDVEGSERRGRFFSRVAHVPTGSSGLTIGRGYDMKERSRSEIADDLMTVGIDEATARRFSNASGLRGAGARQFIADNSLASVEITPLQQKRLFMLTYEELAGDVIRICRKADVVARYGATVWESLLPAIRDLLVDLRYRGDYTGSTRQVVQKPAVDNDLAAFTSVLCDESYWRGQRGVPKDRFQRRCRYLRQA